MGYQWAADTFATIVSTFVPLIGSVAIESTRAIRDYVQSGSTTAASGAVVSAADILIGAYAKWISGLEKAGRSVSLFFFGAQQSFSLIGEDYGKALAAAADIRSFVDQQSDLLAELETHRSELSRALGSLEANLNALDCREVENRASLDEVSSILRQIAPPSSLNLTPIDFSALNPPATAQTVTPTIRCSAVCFTTGATISGNPSTRAAGPAIASSMRLAGK
jgi:hypothetical protein